MTAVVERSSPDPLPGCSTNDGRAGMRVHGSGVLELPASVLTIGAFDGVHRGHQVLIRQTVSRAEEMKVPSIAYTFDPPPKAFFGGAQVLTTGEEKTRRLAGLGLDHAVVAGFDEAYAARGPEEFLEELAAVNPLEVWVGRDFRFGRSQAGDVETLGAHFTTRVLEPVRCARGEIVSSGRVRALRAKGSLREARMLLGWDA